MPDSSDFLDNLDLFSPTNDDNSTTVSPLFGRDITKSDRVTLHKAEKDLADNPLSSPYSIPMSRQEAIEEYRNERGLRRGRPTKLTLERHKFIIDKIREGVPDKVACQLAGCHELSLSEWCTQGRLDIQAGKNTIFSRFSIDVKIARSELEARLAAKWAKIAVEPQTKLKRVYKEQIVTKDDGTIETVKYLDSETIEQVGDGNWQAIAEFMSRRFEGWKKQQTIEQTGPDGGPIQVQMATIDVNMFSVEMREELLRQIKDKLKELEVGEKPVTSE